MARRFGISIVLLLAVVAAAEALLERGGEESIARAAATIEDGMLHARRHGMQPMVIMTLSTRAAVCAAAGDEDGTSTRPLTPRRSRSHARSSMPSGR